MNFRPLPRCARGLAVLLAFLAAVPAAAQDRSVNIAHMMRQMPATAALPTSPYREIHFFDVQAGIAALGRTAIGPQTGELLTRSFPPSLFDAPSDDIDDTWPRIVGFAPRDVRYGLTTAGAPNVTIVLALDDKAMAGVGPALLANGYEGVDHRFGTVYARLGDYRMDITSRNADDPFGGALGLASRVGVRDDVLYQARAWEDFDAISGQPSPHLAAVPPMRAILAAIDDPRFDRLALVRAALVTDPTAYRDPVEDAVAGFAETGETDALADDMTQMRAAAVPVWTTGLYADMAHGGTEIGVLFMAYGSRADAETAQAVITAAWDAPSGMSGMSGRTYLDLFGTAPEFAITGAAPAVLAMILNDVGTPQARLSQRNRAYGRLLETYWQRDMPFLAPN